jgi:hypothetical protein
MELRLSLCVYGALRRVGKCSVPDVSRRRNDLIFKGKNVETQDPRCHTLNYVHRPKNLIVVQCPKFRTLCLARLLHNKLIVLFCAFNCVVLCLIVLFCAFNCVVLCLTVLFCVFNCVVLCLIVLFCVLNCVVQCIQLCCSVYCVVLFIQLCCSVFNCVVLCIQLCCSVY